MFNKNFYPTPEDIVIKLIEFSDTLKKNTINTLILEPSAGKGDIIDGILKYIKNKNFAEPKIHAIEIEPDLQSILRGKKYNIVGNDFLNFSTNTIYDLIIMNPPFDMGVKHFLKAYDILKNGELICLLNAETINNPYSFERKKILEIIKNQNGEVINLGNCFSDAERKTQVEIVMIKVKKEYFSSKMFDDFKFKKNEEIPDFEKYINSGNDLVSSNFIQSMVDTYNASINLIPDLFKILHKIKKYGFGISFDDIAKSMNYAIYNSSISDINKIFKHFYTEINNKIRENAWEMIFEKTNINQTLTASTRQELEILKKENDEMEFNIENIKNLIEILFLNKNKIMEKCIEDAFDYLTKYHIGNRVHVEGWKTNDKYKVNRKFILPFIVTNNKYNGGSYMSYRYEFDENLNDLDRAICHITGSSFNKIKKISDTIRKNIYEKNEIGSNWIESEFFKIRYYKKGTSHFIFKDEYIWKKFNLIACKSKNWLPQGKTDAENLLLLGNNGNIK